MTSLRLLRLRLISVAIYRNVLNSPIPSALYKLIFADERDLYALTEAYRNVFSALALTGAVDGLSKEIEEMILSDENPYTKALAAGKTPHPSIEKAACEEIRLFSELAAIDTDMARTLWPGLFGEDIAFPEWNRGETGNLFLYNNVKLTKYLSQYHRKHGCGIYSVYPAFFWKDGVRPIPGHDPIKLSDLKEYESERAQIVENTENFVMGLSASNMLIYGDRGTGKSVSVHAVLNEFKDRGLRMIELSKEQLKDLPLISESLKLIPLKFIIFVDDLSFSESDDCFSAMKAILEGSLSVRPANILIYATSNRRHLVREHHTDRQGDEVHAVDTMQEQLSLSDRFGITVTFINPDKEKYLSIVKKIADDKGLLIAPDLLQNAAERFALSRGGRSPRIAKQFTEYLAARLARGLNPD